VILQLLSIYCNEVVIHCTCHSCKNKLYFKNSPVMKKKTKQTNMQTKKWYVLTTPINSKRKFVPLLPIESLLIANRIVASITDLYLCKIYMEKKDTRQLFHSLLHGCLIMKLMCSYYLMYNAIFPFFELHNLL
jgi:hypothetical protein